MAWPTNDGSQNVDIAAAWEIARAVITRLKRNVTALNSSSPIDTNNVVSLVAVLGNAKEQLTSIAAVNMTALTAYARTQIVNQTFDAAVELPAIRAAVDTLLNWFITNTPQDASNYLLLVKYNANGGLQWRMLTGGQETAVKTQLNVFLSAVD